MPDAPHADGDRDDADENQGDEDLQGGNKGTGAKKSINSKCHPKILKKSCTRGVKRLNKKELTSRQVGQSFHGLDALCLSLLKIAGTTADKNWRERKL